MKGKELRKKRKELKLTQAQLGNILGVSARTIINYEAGAPIPESKNELLHNFINGDNVANIINVDNNHGSIAGGNFIQVSLPTEGTQKIIKPDGTVKITTTTLKDQDRTDESLSINVRMREKLEDMERLIESLHNTIKAKDETIEILKSQLNK